ncbi:nucleotidyltransferase domain-containing protein [Flavobacterium acetivorans]|uniref:nucleotidyltransferase domain-containing protein n=1 Tax=Flavobacterium acetivorans TaxID=2893883 RepID=UPI001E3C2871|nr:nucleotidyltransferase domain-containing protein [Flavobacterium sp. F-29]UFH35759.1 nucleotidyltransferase domain-containing protein [Flavobacterium sp. F-29]
MKYGLLNEDIAKIKEVFENFPEIKSAILYGSRAKGNYRSDSDIDLTLEGSGLSLSKIFEIEMSLDDLLLPYKIDLSVKSKIENQSLLNHIDRVGVVFWERTV